MTKQKPDLVIDKLGTHLFRCTYADGRQSFKWDWDKLLEEVQAATSLVNVTEVKVKKTRKKKTD